MDPNQAKQKKKKKSTFFYKGGAAKKRGILPGMKGILITCVRGKEKFSVIEALNLINEHIERIIEEQKANGTFKGFNEKEDKEDGGEEDNDDEEEGGGGEDNDGEDDGGPARKRPKLTGKVAEDSDDEGKDGGEIDFRAAFDKEMNQLKEKDPSKKLASNVFIEMDCVLFIRVHSSIDPVEVVRRIFIEAETTKVAKTRHCSRFTPVEAVCHADFDSFEKLGPVFDKHFRQPDQKPCTFSVQYNARNHVGGIEREAATKKVASMIGRPHRVDLKNSEVHVMIEVMQGVCCVSVVSDYKRFFKYNIVSVLGIKISSNVLLMKKIEDQKKANQKNDQSSAATVEEVKEEEAKVTEGAKVEEAKVEEAKVEEAKESVAKEQTE